MSLPSLFKTTAYFYLNAEGRACRKFLDIKQDGNNIAHPQLIIVMLNPGRCGEGEVIEMDREVPVKADPTLYRVQGFMNAHELSWVRVLNLSDIQEKSSDQFFKNSGISESSLIPEHSVFHPARQHELDQHVNGATPLLLAWGLDSRSKNLASSAVRVMKENGYNIINERGPHYHPLVRPTMDIPVWLESASAAYRKFQASKGVKENIEISELDEEMESSMESKIRFAFKFFIKYSFAPPIITEARIKGKWNEFAELLRASGLRPYVGTDEYDFIYADGISNAKALYELLLQHNGKKVIIDAASNPAMLSKKGVIEILEGAVCSSPDSGAKWKVGQGYDIPNKRPFVFNGKLVLLVEQSMEELRRNSRFAYLVRDCTLV